jgi:hypothetical protein
VTASPDDKTDGRVSISEVALCEIAGVHRPTRRKWASRGLLEQRRGGYTELDAVELAVLATLTGALAGADALIAWNELRDQLKALVPPPVLDVVFDTQYKRAALAVQPEDIPKLVRHGRPVRVIPIGETVANVREAFRRIAAATAPAASNRRKRGHSGPRL